MLNTFEFHLIICSTPIYKFIFSLSFSQNSIHFRIRDHIKCNLNYIKDLFFYYIYIKIFIIVV